MNVLIRVPLLSLLLSMSFNGFASISPDGIWTDIAARGVEKSFEYRSLSADTDAIREQLKLAPFLGSAEPGIEFFLPSDTGGNIALLVYEDSVMEDGLAEKFPELKTYYVEGVDDPSISGRLDVTPLGLHGVLQTEKGRLFIEPELSYQPELGNSRHYRIFQQSDYPTPKQPYQCKLHKGGAVLHSSSAQRISLAARSAGTSLRTYRLAIAATAEYSAAVSGGAADKTKAMAAIVTAVNRLNEVYQRDLGVKFKLVTNNDKLIFTNAATDGFSNDDGNKLIDEAGPKINKIIGLANYDIGHVFSTGGGGLAGFGVVCGSSKADGITGSSNPVGDPYVIDYVAHEIGHQFMAAHTFNAENGSSCDKGNRSGSSAFEPGSGSTIMSYAGICGDQNIQANSNAYFHARSLGAIRGFIEDKAAGGACGTVSTVTNAVPTANAGSDYFIPANTPFQLTGQGSDADAADVSNLNYTWEQYDLGAGSKTLAAMQKDNGSGPLFRSFSGTSSPVRNFPKLDAILKNNLASSLGEVLPTTDRKLNFRLTVRSGAAGRSGFAQDDVQLTVKKVAGPFVVTAPKAGDNFTQSSTQWVKWNVANTDQAPVSCSYVRIDFSVNGGQKFTETLLASTENDGEQMVTMPAVNVADSRIKVACLNNIFFSVNPGKFSVAGVASGLAFVQFDSATKSYKEGSAAVNNIIINVQRSGNLAQASEVSYTVLSTGANAVDTQDFMAAKLPAGVVRFTSGQASQAISIAVKGDSDIEQDEQFKLVLSLPKSAQLGSQKEMLVTLQNDDKAPVTTPTPIADGGATAVPVASSGGGGSMGLLSVWLLLAGLVAKVFRQLPKLWLIIFSCAALSACHASSRELGPDEVNTGHLDWLKNANAEVDAYVAFNQEDTRLWVYSDRSGIIVPGVDKAEVDKVLEVFTLRRTEGMSDVIYSPEHRDRRVMFLEYAAKYNSFIINRSGFFFTETPY